MRQWRTWGAVAAIVAVAAAGALALRTRSGTSEATSFTEVIAVERGNLVADITLTGEVFAERRAELSFDVNRIPLLELYVTPGQQVREGEVLARIDPASLERQVDQSEADLLSAEEALQEAEEPYTELDRQKAELDVAQAEAALEEARQSLQEMLDPDLAEEAVQDAVRELREASDKLSALQVDSATQEQMERLQLQADVAEVEHGGLLDNPNPTEESRDRQLAAYNRMLDAKDSLQVAQARAALDLLNAQDKVVQAQEALAELLAGPDALALAQASNRVSQAEYNLARVRENLATVLAGPDPKALQLAHSRYDAAKATLEEAQATLEASTMVAPFDATVISVGAEVGDLVSSNTNVVTLADLTDLQVLANVDETDISQVEVGQEVEITFDAFPGRRLRGRVLEVPLEGNLVQNVVTYEVLVSLEGAEGVSLRSGMTANVSIVVGRRENALLVPALAVWQAEEGNVVMVQDSPQGEATAARVELGLSDGLYVEVLRGLNEGDQVVVEYELAEEQQGPFGGFGVMIRGGQPRTGPSNQVGR
jgi:HlyD family secretion protein